MELNHGTHIPLVGKRNHIGGSCCGSRMCSWSLSLKIYVLGSRLLFPSHDYGKGLEVVVILP